MKPVTLMPKDPSFTVTLEICQAHGRKKWKHVLRYKGAKISFHNTRRDAVMEANRITEEGSNTIPCGEA